MRPKWLCVKANLLRYGDIESIYELRYPPLRNPPPTLACSPFPVKRYVPAFALPCLANLMIALINPTLPSPGLWPIWSLNRPDSIMIHLVRIDLAAERSEQRQPRLGTNVETRLELPPDAPARWMFSRWTATVMRNCLRKIWHRSLLYFIEALLVSSLSLLLANRCFSVKKLIFQRFVFSEFRDRTSRASKDVVSIVMAFLQVLLVRSLFLLLPIINSQRSVNWRRSNLGWSQKGSVWTNFASVIARYRVLDCYLIIATDYLIERRLIKFCVCKFKYNRSEIGFSATFYCCILHFIRDYSFSCYYH